MLGAKVGKKINRSNWGTAAIFLVLTLIGLFMSLPFIYAILQSLKPMDELFIFPPRFFVNRPTIRNYGALFRLTNTLWVPFSRTVFNSIVVTITGTFAHVFLASMAAYPLAKGKFPGREIIFNTVVLALLFNGGVAAIPQYILMAKSGMANTFFALILPPVASPLGLFLMKQFMECIPDSTLESARIDGAGVFRIYWKIVMPQAKPAWITLIIFAFQALWSSEGGSLIMTEQMKVLPTTIKQIASYGLARSDIGAAAAVVLMIPPMAVFIVSQSNIMETMQHSGIKG